MPHHIDSEYYLIPVFFTIQGHLFISQCKLQQARQLQNLGFVNLFLVFYLHTYDHVHVHGERSSSFEMNGVDKQGCLASSFLFDLVSEEPAEDN